MPKAQKTLDAVFALPTRSNIRWADIESMLVAFGAEKSEGSGSRVRFVLNDARATLHRPHPRPEASKPQIESVRRFLIAAGITP